MHGGMTAQAEYHPPRRRGTGLRFEDDGVAPMTSAAMDLA
jgi:hypothetical protein